MSDEDTQGATFSGFVLAELEQERARRSSLDARGTGLVTTSSALATLLLGAAAVVTDAKTFTPSTFLLATTVLTFVLFLATGIAGILAARTIPYDVASSATLEEMLTDRWGTPDVDAKNVVARLNALTLTSLRRGNDQKAWTAVVGLGLQLGAVLSLGVGLLVELVRAV